LLSATGNCSAPDSNSTSGFIYYIAPVSTQTSTTAPTSHEQPSSSRLTLDIDTLSRRLQDAALFALPPLGSLDANGNYTNANGNGISNGVATTNGAAINGHGDNRAIALNGLDGGSLVNGELEPGHASAGTVNGDGDTYTSGALTSGHSNEIGHVNRH
jgi:hypothetical protein